MLAAEEDATAEEQPEAQEEQQAEEQPEEQPEAPEEQQAEEKPEEQPEALEAMAGPTAAGAETVGTAAQREATAGPYYRPSQCCRPNPPSAPL